MTGKTRGEISLVAALDFPGNEITMIHICSDSTRESA